MIPDWTLLDAAQLRDYLKTESGKKLIDSIETCRPRITTKNPDEVFGEAMKREGWEMLGDKIIAAANFDEKPPTAPVGIDVSKD